ncbi:hypothetical protein C1708_33510 [Streptomyces sp. DH-12]|nr:hypothetical protein C1708_33510 [Streptomyces sp. DH-12]
MGRWWSGDLRRCGVPRFPTKSGGVSAAGSGWVLLNASLTRPGTVRGARSESQGGLGGFVWIIGRTRGRCPRCGVRPGRWSRSSRSGWRYRATASGG